MRADGPGKEADTGASRRRVSVSGIVAAAIGVALFAWFVRSVGAAQIWEGLRSVGLGYAVIIGITGVRFALRAAALSWCFEPPHRVPFASAFAAVLAGDAIGNLTPLGLIASEPTKAALLRPHAPLGTALATVAIETLLYTLTVGAMIAATTLALLATVDLPSPMRTTAVAAVAAILIAFAAIAVVLWRRPAIALNVLSAVLPGSATLRSGVLKLHELEQQIYTFATRRRDALVPVALCELSFHALGVVEVFVTLWLVLGSQPALVTAFILEGANRLVQVVFKPVPLRAGVDEITTGSFTELLGYPTALGGTLAIVRKVRTVFWVLIGTLILVRRGGWRG